MSAGGGLLRLSYPFSFWGAPPGVGEPFKVGLSVISSWSCSLPQSLPTQLRGREVLSPPPYAWLLPQDPGSRDPDRPSPWAVARSPRVPPRPWS